MAINKNKYMSMDEVQKFRTETESRAIMDLKAGRVGGVNTWAVIDLALSTGLRVSEMAGIAIEDVDLDAKRLFVTRVKRRNKCKETIAINDGLALHLKDYIAWTGRVQGPLFFGSRGPLSAQGLQRIWKAAIKNAGLSKTFSIHSARHTMAIDMLKKTGDLRKVQRQLGHISPVTTANMYANISFADNASDSRRKNFAQKQGAQDSNQAENNNARCDACNNPLSGQGRKIESGQVLCDNCLKYFR